MEKRKLIRTLEKIEAECTAYYYYCWPKGAFTPWWKSRKRKSSSQSEFMLVVDNFGFFYYLLSVRILIEHCFSTFCFSVKMWTHPKEFRTIKGTENKISTYQKSCIVEYTISDRLKFLYPYSQFFEEWGFICYSFHFS